ncbi:hypothetical protein R75461_07876 [Paraburkholderia nemoris]|uniref:fimbrial protein n=1 Tax=Paraburkholderia nemoris TaxID=2793076 RepID=UPI00190C0164|nr:MULTISPECIES: fimbrial protein [Paraburkholderia]MBK3786908.1 type 1 fimbrial protein [Paraburkholderia aspalathi]CAE6858894.1 hypothetical protein R75461_07876 [Paraburkholderia nemoris]
MMKKLLQLWLLAVILAGPGRAWAQCSGAVGGLPSVISLSPASTTANVDPNAPLGTIIASGGISWNLGNVSCTTSGTLSIASTTGSPLGPYNTYPTNVPGIGITIAWGSAQTTYWPTLPYTAGTVITYGNNGGVTAQYIKTGPIPLGLNTISGEVGAVFAPNISSKIVSFQSNQQFFLSNPTCTVATPSISVPLGAIPLSRFTGPGSTSPAMPLSILLHCSGGTGTGIGNVSGSSTVNVAVTLTDNTNPANFLNTLTLTPASTATGLGIQVINPASGSVISYGPDSSVAGNTNQWSAGAAQNGTFTIQLTARYIQLPTASKVTPGTANGIATFTMSYQ